MAAYSPPSHFQTSSTHTAYQTIFHDMSQDNQSYEHNVFINCPFDAGYAPLFRSAVFTIADCGFVPRTALDVSDASEVRIHKIYSMIEECRLSVHDLSRTQLDVGTDLPRFNMPLEFGIFLGAKFLGNPQQRRKACLVFDERPYRYQMYLSDVAGQDISWHANDQKTLVFRIRDWLASLSGDPLPSGSLIWDHFTTFQGELRHSCETLRQRPDELTHPDFLHHVRLFKTAYEETLEIDGKKAVTNPKTGDIRRAVRTLETKGDGYLVLGKGASGLSYIQAYYERDRRKWILEYQDGHLDEHYRANDLLDSDSVARSLENYIQGEERWRKETNWKRVEIR
jgi:hypothetical protein